MRGEPSARLFGICDAVIRRCRAVNVLIMKCVGSRLGATGQATDLFLTHGRVAASLDPTRLVIRMVETKKATKANFVALI